MLMERIVWAFHLFQHRFIRLSQTVLIALTGWAGCAVLQTGGHVQTPGAFETLNPGSGVVETAVGWKRRNNCNVFSP